ncbi:endonuclease III domain-containing protein [Lederbergia sp. NSJ-179]|uniref:endonuclease III domain-containing protein n=1 Tax=Lederbergia sp. NSJ-179 TaxID=2931402 RepID=UPI001FD3BF5A|nr:endonuclease III domain-containing protein [Lederbergia sp. NSJ-179]MCJ7841975.1 endonuclease III domain-containing protein [Lederbergia sp. NSJ-179]
MQQEYTFIYERLYQHYGPQNWWPAETPFEMLIGAILVQNTSWRNVEKALVQLKPFLDPKTIERLPEAELAQLIKSSVFFNIKAKRIKAFIQWFNTYEYDIEKIKKIDKKTLRGELLNIHGIGRETADVMLLYAFHKPIFVVDAYARRIFTRIGNDVPASYDFFRKQVENELPADLILLQEYHALLVEHGKIHCKTKPLCVECPLNDLCDFHLTSFV